MLRRHREASKRPWRSPAIAVFCSGQGTNFQAILEAIRRKRLRARVSVMVTDNPRAAARRRAAKAKIPAVVVPRNEFSSREAFDRALACAVEKSGAKLIVLAGFMRILSPGFVRKFRNRILNVHPSLLPSFPGAHAVRDALRRRVPSTGVTIHFVDEQVDHGPVLLQEPVPIRKGDTEKSLLRRIHRVEHRLYPRAIQQILEASSCRNPKRSSKKS